MDISVLIVDDDKLVVDKLVEGVNWTQLGIGTVHITSGRPWKY